MPSGGLRKRPMNRLFEVVPPSGKGSFALPPTEGPEARLSAIAGSVAARFGLNKNHVD